MIRAVLLSGVLAISVSSLYADESTQGNRWVLNLDAAVNAAQLNDPWLVGNQHSQDAVDALSISAGTLPDPKMSIGMANLPMDTFNFDQEGMTQFKVGISQMFPRGDSLSIRQQQLQLMGTQYPYQRENRKARIVVTVSQLWLDAYKAQESIALIDKNRDLFEQLADVAQASYSSALGRTRQQDIVRAQLELTRLDDRLTVLHQHQEMSLQRLSEWLSDSFVDQYSKNTGIGQFLLSSGFSLSRQLPDTGLLNPQLYTTTTTVDPSVLLGYFSRHPAVMTLKQKIKASRAGIELARQKYKPAWGLNAGYGYRSDTPVGNNRADLFSLGVSFDLPVFTAKRQDKQLQSAVSRTEAVKTEEWLLLRKLMASFETSRAKLQRLNERKTLYQGRLLPQMHEQADASLTAYTNDDGDFSEVVRARIAELNAEIDELIINVERQRAIIQLNYFFETSVDAVTADDHRMGDK
ncbi:MAG: TolC family protein [Gammaproteobacteria bacterium]|nr:TolC family protein [Gammaproteobacteria bacterium]